MQLKRKIFVSNTMMVLCCLLGQFFVSNLLLHLGDFILMHTHCLSGLLRSPDEIFMIAFAIIGLSTVLVILFFSQLYTRKTAKKIMEPIDALTKAAKRIEDGDLSTPIDYQGIAEFETVCHAFNEMQSSLSAEKERNKAYEKARTDMISGISHDLRTPLTSVKGFLKGLRDGVANTEEKREQYLAIAYAKACEIDSLLQRLFLFSKIETGNMPFYKEPTDLAHFLTQFIENCKEDMELRGGRINFAASEGTHFALIDAEQMKRVIYNLIDNSVKYAHAETLQIQISLASEDQREIITFHDNGVGVPEEKLPHLFEQFYRCDESRSRKNMEGNGLGLYTAKFIVAAHDGTIDISNDNGLKTVISLPGEQIHE